MIAAGIMAGALVSLAQVLAVSVATNRAARSVSYTTVLAAQKTEELRGLASGAGVPSLELSPPGTLTANVAGWADYVDRFGDVLGGGPTPPDGTAYVRRWAVEPLPARSGSTLVLQVRVARLSTHEPDERAGAVARPPDEARLMSVVTRRAP
jgi:hypothetical protein